MYTPEYFISMLLGLPGLLVAITFHEMAHGYVAYRLGDPTAKRAGRLTLNPIKHIDPVGFICLLVFRFGWAKPVPVNAMYFKDRQKGIVLVSMAGALANILIAFVSLFIATIISEMYSGLMVLTTTDLTYYVWMIFYYMYIYNLFFAIFNLIPIPPLDGSKVLFGFLPAKYQRYYYQYEKYGYVLLLLLIVTGLLNLILDPLYQLFSTIMVNFVGLFF
jgi:Zn-dependent protease